MAGYSALHRTIFHYWVKAAFVKLKYINFAPPLQFTNDQQEKYTGKSDADPVQHR